jgi:hypothetical protein
MKLTKVAFGSGNEQPAASFRAVRSGLVRGALALAAVFSVPGISVADEGGVSFWLPGLYGSLSAVPQAAPGWSFLTFNYYTNVSAGANVSAAREVQIGRLPPTTATANLSANLHAQADLQWIQPNYAFATPVLGGQLTMSMASFVGWQRPTCPGRCRLLHLLYLRSLAPTASTAPSPVWATSIGWRPCDGTTASTIS